MQILKQTGKIDYYRCFGGSGLLAHTAKREKPLARVIYNDFDNYAERLNHIKETNQLRQEIYQIVDEIIPKIRELAMKLKLKSSIKSMILRGLKTSNA